MFTYQDNILYLTRGDCAAISAQLLQQAVNGGEQLPYELQPADTVTLTVRQMPSEDSPVLLQVTSEPGSSRIVMLTEHTRDIPAGRYSADVQLNLGGGPQVMTFWPGLPARERDRGKVRNFENFIVLPEVTRRDIVGDAEPAYIPEITLIGELNATSIEIAGATGDYVSYAEAQMLDATQQATARGNIGAAASEISIAIPHGDYVGWYCDGRTWKHNAALDYDTSNAIPILPAYKKLKLEFTQMNPYINRLTFSTSSEIAPNGNGGDDPNVVKYLRGISDTAPVEVEIPETAKYLFVTKDLPVTAKDGSWDTLKLTVLAEDVLGAVVQETAKTRVRDENAGAFQQLVTDADGNVKWEDRTHYTEAVSEVLFDGELIQYSNNYGIAVYHITVENRHQSILNSNATYTVTCNEVEYADIVPATSEGGSVVTIGNLFGDGTIPFNIADESNSEVNPSPYLVMAIPADSVGDNLTVRIVEKRNSIIKIPEKYIPSTIARTADLHPVATSGSWNDLEDRTHYKGTTVNKVLVKDFGTVTFSTTASSSGPADEGYPTYYKAETPLGYNVEFVDGTEYVAAFDGVEYPLYVEAENKYGNIGMMYPEVENTGEPFAYWGADAGLVASSSGDHTIAIYALEEIETYYPLDPKYLPEEVPLIPTATVGQTIVVKAVDENGKPTEWGAAAFRISATQSESGEFSDCEADFAISDLLACVNAGIMPSVHFRITMPLSSMSDPALSVCEAERITAAPGYDADGTYYNIQMLFGAGATCIYVVMDGRTNEIMASLPPTTAAE